MGARDERIQFAGLEVCYGTLQRYRRKLSTLLVSFSELDIDVVVPTIDHIYPVLSGIGDFPNSGKAKIPTHNVLVVSHRLTGTIDDRSQQVGDIGVL
jgi:hypothetical protein